MASSEVSRATVATSVAGPRLLPRGTMASELGPTPGLAPGLRPRGLVSLAKAAVARAVARAPARATPSLEINRVSRRLLLR
jgi:hypothetical protein